MQFYQPEDNGGSLITDYELEMSTDGATFTSAGLYGPTLDTHTLTSGSDGLVAGQVYYFRVKAVNDKGLSLWSFIT